MFEIAAIHTYTSSVKVDRLFIVLRLLQDSYVPVVSSEDTSVLQAGEVFVIPHDLTICQPASSNAPSMTRFVPLQRDEELIPSRFIRSVSCQRFGLSADCQTTIRRRRPNRLLKITWAIAGEHLKAKFPALPQNFSGPSLNAFKEGGP